MSPTAVRHRLLLVVVGLALACSTTAEAVGTRHGASGRAANAAPHRGKRECELPIDPTSLTVNQDGLADETVAYDVVVPLPAGASCVGSVSFYDNVNTSDRWPGHLGPGTPCEARASNIFTSAGSHSITAVFTPPAGSSDLIAATSSAGRFQPGRAGHPTVC